MKARCILLATVPAAILLLGPSISRAQDPGRACCRDRIEDRFDRREDRRDRREDRRDRSEDVRDRREDRFDRRG